MIFCIPRLFFHKIFQKLSRNFSRNWAKIAKTQNYEISPCSVNSEFSKNSPKQCFCEHNHWVSRFYCKNGPILPLNCQTLVKIGIIFQKPCNFFENWAKCFPELSKFSKNWVKFSKNWAQKCKNSEIRDLLILGQGTNRWKKKPDCVICNEMMFLQKNSILGVLPHENIEVI